MPIKSGVGGGGEGRVPECLFPHTKYGFNGNISFTFQAIQKLSAHNMNLCNRVFCKFLSDFLSMFGRK